MDPGIDHHVLWASCPLYPEEVAREVARRRRGYQPVTFVNPPALKSIPTVRRVDGLWGMSIDNDICYDAYGTVGWECACSFGVGVRTQG